MRLFAMMMVAAAALWASPAFTQPLPDTLRSAGITQAQWEAVRAEARNAAARANIAEAALLAAAERAGLNLLRSGRYSPAELSEVIIGQLETQAQTISELQERLEVLARADDPEIARLLTEARVAISEGRLDDADAALAAAEESDLAAVAVAEARAERARARVADAIVERGRLDRIQGGGDAANVQEAIARYEADLRGMDRTLAPADWARTQFNLGVAYAILAQSGDDEARVLALGALQAAASGFAELQNAESQTRAERLIAALQVH